ncbi:MAG: GNAT family N-acetyltransferase [Nocardioidaceae bacterium]|nr:GNAT family N-acetyltransferase [Nocardioidaceae bacterium]
MVLAHGEIYAEQLGWSTEFEAMVAAIVAEYAAGHDPAREGAWIAEVDGERAGCVSLVADEEPGTARLRILLVTPTARGLGVGSLLVGTCLDLARKAGYERVTLWTVAGLDSARRIYEAAGFRLVREEPQHRFGHEVIGQTWTLALR